ETLVRMLAEICKARQRDRHAESVSLADVAQEAAAEINQLFPGRAIEYDWPASPFVLTVPRPDLRQVLVQLMGNAVQATPEPAPVQIEIGAREAPGRREFWVADKGRGLPLELQARLQDFLSGQSAKNPGNGLGLVLVRRIIDHWGGKLRIESGQAR